MRNLRRQVFERYPASPHAAEAYFFYYSYADYIQGNQEAMAHLQQMASRYPTRSSIQWPLSPRV